MREALRHCPHIRRALTIKPELNGPIPGSESRELPAGLKIFIRF